MRKNSRDARLYFLAALAAVAALFLRSLLDPLLAAQNPYHTIWLAVVFSALYCGIGPTIVCVAIGLLGIWYWFLPPYYSFAGKTYSEISGMLAGLKMNLDRLFTADGNKEELASECCEIVDKCMTETRTISHLLHPPLLDEAGLVSATRWYVDGFAQRSGIEVNIELPSKLDRLPRDVETALFRALQEGLTNVHRHSGASAVDIRLRLETGRVHLEITDNGRGIAEGKLTHLTDSNGEAGIGLAGMRERVRNLRGSLDIRSDTRGTRLIVSIPIVPRAPVDSAQDCETIRRDHVA